MGHTSVKIYNVPTEERQGSDGLCPPLQFSPAHAVVIVPSGDTPTACDLDLGLQTAGRLVLGSWAWSTVHGQVVGTTGDHGHVRHCEPLCWAAERLCCLPESFERERPGGTRGVAASSSEQS